MGYLALVRAEGLLIVSVSERDPSASIVGPSSAMNAPDRTSCPGTKKRTAVWVLHANANRGPLPHGATPANVAREASSFAPSVAIASRSASSVSNASEASSASTTRLYGSR